MWPRGGKRTETSKRACAYLLRNVTNRQFNNHCLVQLMSRRLGLLSCKMELKCPRYSSQLEMATKFDSVRHRLSFFFNQTGEVIMAIKILYACDPVPSSSERDMLSD